METCVAKKKNGEQCSRLAKPPSDFCWQHQGNTSIAGNQEAENREQSVPITDNDKEIVKVLLEKYKTLNQGIYQRIDLQQKLLNFQILFIGIVFALIAKNPSTLATIDSLPLLLFAPVVLMFFVWGHSNHDLMIIAYAVFLFQVIRKKTGEKIRYEIPSWEIFLVEHRKKNNVTLTILGSEYIFAILLCIISLSIAAALTYSFRPVKFSIAPSYDATNALCAAIFIEFLLLVLTVRLRVKILYQYLTISRQD